MAIYLGDQMLNAYLGRDKILLMPESNEEDAQKEPWDDFTFNMLYDGPSFGPYRYGERTGASLVGDLAYDHRMLPGRDPNFHEYAQIGANHNTYLLDSTISDGRSQVRYLAQANDTWTAILLDTYYVFWNNDYTEPLLTNPKCFFKYVINIIIGNSSYSFDMTPGWQITRFVADGIMGAIIAWVAGGYQRENYTSSLNTSLRIGDVVTIDPYVDFNLAGCRSANWPENSARTELHDAMKAHTLLMAKIILIIRWISVEKAWNRLLFIFRRKMRLKQRHFQRIKPFINP